MLTVLGDLFHRFIATVITLNCLTNNSDKIIGSHGIRATIQSNRLQIVKSFK